MSQTRKAQKPGRGERHSAAWGKRLSIVLLMLVSEMAFAQGWNENSNRAQSFSKLAPEVAAHMQHFTANQTVKVIVQYRQTPQSAQFGRMQNLGARVGARLGLVRGAAFSLPVNALAALEADPEVVSVTIDHAVNATDDYTDGAANVSSVWNSGYTGSGIGVAVIDSGINDSHTDLWDSTETHSRVVYRQDFTGTSNSNHNGARYDLYGHGTHVAGIIGGNGYNSGGQYEGVAPNVNLIDLRVLDANGTGSDSNVIAAIQQAIALKNTYNIRIINLSLGRGVPSSYTQDPLCQAVESAWKNGIVVVVAAGNYGRLSVNGSNGFGTITAPGNDPYVLTVGAMKSMGTMSRADDQLASYSSKGPTTYDHVVKPDLVADGNLVVSLAAPGATLEANYPADQVDGPGTNNYFTLSGTSMATPVVTGTVALLLQRNSTLTPDQIKARLMKSAHKVFPTSTVASVPHLSQTYTEFYDLFSVGAGYLDAQAALANSDLAPATVGSALSPYAVYNSSTKTVTIVNGNSSVSAGSIVWGSSIVWGTSIVWGSNVSGSSIVWGSSLPWNNDGLQAFSIVWGASDNCAATSIVWGASLLSGNNAFSDAGDDEQ